MNHVNTSDWYNSLRQELEVLTQKESKLSMDLFEKYGKGEVDLEQGTITPTE